MAPELRDKEMHYSIDLHPLVVRANQIHVHSWFLDRCYRAIFPPLSVFPPGKMARGKNYYRSVIEPFFPHSQFSPRKNGYIVGFPPGRMAI